MFGNATTFSCRRLKDGKQLMESDHIKFTKESDTVFAFKIDSMQMDDCCTYTVSRKWIVEQLALELVQRGNSNNIRS